MSARLAHQSRLLRDVDALHAGVVSLAALLLSGGLLYGFYWIKVWRAARCASPLAHGWIESGEARRALLFGKHARNGVADADFLLRIDRALCLTRAHPQMSLLLLGGGTMPSEAQIAETELRRRGVADSVSITLESSSNDTLENLRHCRELLDPADPSPLLLVSSRYHLARCSLFARNLGLPHELCAAEAEWQPSVLNQLRLLQEAGLYLWVDVGLRWADLIGHRRMQQRLR